MPGTASAAIRGTLAAMAMTAVRRVSSGLGLVQRTPPEELLKDGAPTLAARIPPERREAAVELLHWGIGAGGGALFAVLPSRLRRRRVAGPIYGLAILAAFESVIRPVLHGPDGRRLRPVERLALGTDHVLYGLILGEHLPPRG